MTVRTLLIDADILIYTAAAASQESFDFGSGNVTRVKRTVVDALAKVGYDVGVLERTLGAGRAIMCLSSRDDVFRKKLCPSYKGNRKQAKPILYGALREAVKKTFETFERPGLEGDDIMGILATHPSKVPGEKVIVSIDKDMEQIPGLLFNPNKDTDARMVTAEDGALYHLYQTLVGDPTDNYPGCPGIGAVKAIAVLNAEASWSAVVTAFEAKGLTAEDALLQARLAKILQYPDYNFKTKEPILWTPTKTLSTTSDCSETPADSPALASTSTASPMTRP